MPRSFLRTSVCPAYSCAARQLHTGILCESARIPSHGDAVYNIDGDGQGTSPATARLAPSWSTTLESLPLLGICSSIATTFTTASSGIKLAHVEDSPTTKSASVTATASAARSSSYAAARHLLPRRHRVNERRTASLLVSAPPARLLFPRRRDGHVDAGDEILKVADGPEGVRWPRSMRR